MVSGRRGRLLARQRHRVVTREAQHHRIYLFRIPAWGASQDGAPVCLASILTHATIDTDHDQPHSRKRIMPDLPSGTVTFLFTDIEGSTPRWERDRQAMAQAVDRHLALLRGAIEAHGGVLFKMVGDAVQAAFPPPPMRSLQRSIPSRHSEGAVA